MVLERATPQAAGGGDILPTRFFIESMQSPYSGVNGTIIQPTEGASYWEYHRQNNGAVDSETVYDFATALQDGTWEFVLGHSQSTNRGIYTVAISTDAASWTDVGTIDGYAASETAARSAITGITVPSGTKYIRLKMSSKNASSSAHYAVWSHLSGSRTGA